LWNGNDEVMIGN